MVFHFLLVVTFLSVLTFNTFLWLAKRHKDYLYASKRASLLTEVTRLRKEAEKFNTPSTYFKCAKLQRQANAKDKELQALEEAPDTTRVAGMSVTGLIKLANMVKVISLGLLSMTMWGQTVAHVPLHISSPFAYLLAMPHGRSLSAFGGVALFPWLLLCDKASNALARALFPPRAPLVQSRAVGASSMQHGDSDANIQDVKDE